MYLYTQRVKNQIAVWSINHSITDSAAIINDTDTVSVRDSIMLAQCTLWNSAHDLTINSIVDSHLLVARNISPANNMVAVQHPTHANALNVYAHCTHADEKSTTATNQ